MSKTENPAPQEKADKTDSEQKLKVNKELLRNLNDKPSEGADLAAPATSACGGGGGGAGGCGR
jgi:hypothetical protein